MTGTGCLLFAGSGWYEVCYGISRSRFCQEPDFAAGPVHQRGRVLPLFRKVFVSSIAVVLATVLVTIPSAAGAGSFAGPESVPARVQDPGQDLSSASTGLVQLVRAADVSLIMVEDRACTYCIRWNKEVGKGYARTAEGRAAPLRRVGRQSGVLDGFAPVIYTPTFILVRDGREVGRITGYPGQFYFWEELAQMMSAAGIARGG